MSSIVLPNGWILTHGVIKRPFGPSVSLVISTESESITVEFAENSVMGAVTATLPVAPSDLKLAEKIGDHCNNFLAGLDAMMPASKRVGEVVIEGINGISPNKS